MSIRQEIYADYVRHIEEHYKENRQAAEVMRNELNRSPLISRGRLIDMPLAIQKVYTAEDDRFFREVVDMTHRICCKVIRHYVENPSYRKGFGFSKELEDLILADPGYDAPLPMARFDIFYNEESGDFRFCEINTDGTSAMNEDYNLDKVNIHNPAHQFIRRKYNLQSYELFDSWVETFLSLYGEYQKSHPTMPPEPTVAIVDFLDKGNIPEFYEFAHRFQRQGIYANVVDIRELRYREGRLYAPEGYEIHGIYRRAVTADVMENYDSVKDLLDAYREGNIFLCGSFRTQVVHAKTFFTVLHTDATRAILTEEEWDFVRKHVPYTCDFGPNAETREDSSAGTPACRKVGSTVDAAAEIAGSGIDLESVIRDKDRYILKPNDSYGSNSVADGKGHTQEEWEALCRAHYGKGYICQEYAPQYATPNVDFMFGDGEFHDYINMNGLYSYNGRFAGVFTRQACGTIIASHQSERNVASYLCTGRR